MAAFTINIPIRTLDADDVKNAFASSYGYEDTVAIGGVTVPNPITKEEFVKQKCINFMLDITRAYLIKVEEISAREAKEVEEKKDLVCKLEKVCGMLENVKVTKKRVLEEIKLIINKFS